MKSNYKEEGGRTDLYATLKTNPQGGMPASHMAVPPPVMLARKGTCLVPCVPLGCWIFFSKADRAQILKLCNLAQLCPLLKDLMRHWEVQFMGDK